MILVIIVTYNGIKWIERSFGQLIDSSISINTVAIDNGSSDGTVQTLKTKYQSVEVIELHKNIGFAQSNNIGLLKAIDENYDYIFLLNQDAWIEKNTLIELLKVFNNKPDAGIVSPIHLNGNKSGLDYAFSDYLSNKNTPGFISDLYCGKLSQAYRTEFVNAAAWLISKKCIEKVGLFDTSLFVHYGEDDNYCQRVKYHDFGIYITPNATICHDREGRTKERPEDFKKINQDLTKKIQYSNPFLQEEVIDDYIKKMKKKYRYKLFSSILRLDFNRLNQISNNYRTEKDLFIRIKLSREAYKTDVMRFANHIVK